MKKSIKNIILGALGTYFLLLGITAMVMSFYRQTPFQIFNACYIGVILIGIGILTRRSFIILSQVYILAIPLIIWGLDFAYLLIFNHPLWGITDYFFSNTSETIDKFITLQHLYTIPVSIYAIKLIGLKRRDAWKWSFIQLALMFFIIAIFAPQKSNINCVFYSCVNLNYGGLPYILVWFLVSFAMAGITALLLNYFLRPKKVKPR